MNILIVSAWCPYPADNGSRLRAYNLIKQLARQGHRLTVIAFGQDGSDLGEAEQGLAAFCAGGVTLYRSRFFQPHTWKALLGYLSPKPRMLLDTWQPDAAREIARQCRSSAHDVILALQLGVAHYIPPDAASPCVLDEVEVSSFVRTLDETISWRKRLRLRLMAAKFRRHVVSLVPRFARWTAVSEDERQAIRRLLGDARALQIDLVPNGVDLQYNSFEPDALYDTDRLIYNGSLAFYANRDAVEYFVKEILPLIRRERPSAALVVTGRDDTLEAGDPLRDAPGLSLTGYLPDIRPAVRAACACVVPLRQGGGTRLKILEAMALGVPVVATARGAEGLGARNGEEILIAETAEEFARATLRLMADPVLRGRIGGRARAFVEARFGWEGIGLELGKLLSSLTPMGSDMTEGLCH